MIQQQQKLVELLVENSGNGNKKSARTLIKEAGYSQIMADRPSVVLKSASFQALLEKYVPDDFVLEKVRRNIEQTDNYMASVKAADLVFKIKGQYAPPKMPVDPYETMSEDELENEIARLESERLKRLTSGSNVTEGEILQDTIEAPVE